jgi:hypothetical protein
MQVSVLLQVPGPWCPEMGTTSNHGIQVRMVSKFKVVLEIKIKYLPLTGIEPGQIALKSGNFDNTIFKTSINKFENFVLIISVIHPFGGGGRR